MRPSIPGAETHISLLYDDPKDFNSLPFVAEMYVERANQIGTEMFNAFSQIRPKH